MPQTHQDPEKASCQCGRPLSAADVASYTSPAWRYLFWRCLCGREWTVRQQGVDPTAPISADEVLEVHQRLAGFRGPLRELLG